MTGVEARQRLCVDLKSSRVWTGFQGLDSEKCRERRSEKFLWLEGKKMKENKGRTVCCENLSTREVSSHFCRNRPAE